MMNWINLGMITPLINQWTGFTITLENGIIPLLKVTCNSPNFALTNGYGYFRIKILSEGWTWGSWVKYYPKDTPEILSFSIPLEVTQLFKEQAFTLQIEFRKYLKYYRSADQDWSITVDVLQDNQPTPKDFTNQILSMLNEIKSAQELISLNQSSQNQDTSTNSSNLLTGLPLVSSSITDSSLTIGLL